MSTSRLTIAIPAYNQPEYLRECLRSIQNQTTSSTTVRVHDDSTTDAVERVCKEFHSLNIEYHKNPTRLGANDNIQQIISAPYDTPYVMIFHHDDTMHPRFVETSLKVLERYPDAAWISSNFRFVAQGGDMQRFVAGGDLNEHERYLNAAELSRAILKHKNISFGSVVYRREKLSNKRLNFSTYAQNNDRPFLFEVAEDKPTLFLTEPLVNYRLHANQDSQTNAALRPEQSRSLMAFYRDQLPQPLQGQDKYQFLKFSTNNLLDSYMRLSNPEEDLQTYIAKAKQVGLYSSWHLRRAGIRALLALHLRK